MNIIFNLLSWLAAVISMVVSLAVAVAAVFLSWYSASDSCQGDRCARLRWVVVAREDILPGQQLTDRLVDEGLHHTTIAVEDIAPRGEIANQYARGNSMVTSTTIAGGQAIDRPAIRAGVVIERHMIGPTAWIADSSEAIVPVAVDPEFAVGVFPGIRVVFMRKGEKESLWAGVSKCGVPTKDPVSSSEAAGFIVASKSDGSDTHKAVVAVRISQKETQSIIALSDGVWRPIVVTASGEKICIPANYKYVGG